jgi:hypothetical protein
VDYLAGPDRPGGCFQKKKPCMPSIKLGLAARKVIAINTSTLASTLRHGIRTVTVLSRAQHLQRIGITGKSLRLWRAASVTFKTELQTMQPSEFLRRQNP